jgi:hypothetical protein
MPRYEFQCLFCERFTEIYLPDGNSLNFRAVRCEFCNNKHLQLNLFVKDSVEATALLQEQIEQLLKRVEELENGEERDQDIQVKN